MDPYAWTPGLCNLLGVPLTDNVRLSLAMWAQTEGMPDYANNVLAATDKITGSRQYNSAGVQIYPSVSAMNNVYSRKLKSSTYDEITAALKTDNMLRIWQAINASPWCPKCQGGKYPNVLEQFLVATGARPGAILVQVFPGAPGQTGPTPDSWDIQIAASRVSIELLAHNAGKHASNFNALRY